METSRLTTHPPQRGGYEFSDSLLAVWPKHMTVEELFALLTSSHCGHFVGIYQLFLSQDLVPHLSPSDLPVALQWVEQQPSRLQLSNHAFIKLSDAIMLRAWENLDSSPEVLDAFTKAALSRLKYLDGILGDRSDSSLNNLLIQDNNKRRQVLEAMVPMLTDSMEDSGWPFLSNPRLVMEEDILWMIERFQATRSTKKRRIWARWIERVFNPWREPAQLEIIFVACQKSVILAKRFAWLLNPVMLDSPEAQRMRADYLDRQRLEERANNRPLLDPPPKERIAQLLHRCETENSAVWWLLTTQMTLEPDSTNEGNQWESDLTTLPGWKAADALTRARMVEAAKKYIWEQDSEPLKWLDRNVWYPPAFAGYKALRLLLQEAPHFIPILSAEVWKKWAPIILTYPTPYDTGEDQDFHRELVRLAYQHAPDEMIHSLMVTIDKENKAHDGHINIIRRLAHCWDDRLADAVLEKTKDITLKPACMGSLLGELLDHRVLEARA
jgi:predicted NACHT family NTPase